MDQKAFQNLDCLNIIADQDESYTIWKKTFHESAPQFEAYANSQPEEIRNILWGYAESGRLMYQRLVNLACEQMDFPNQENRE